MDTLPSGNLRAHKLPSISASVKGGLGLLITANIDWLAAFSTAYWATWKNEEKGEYGGYGLWKIWTCRQHKISDGITNRIDVICDEKMADLSWPGWYVTTQVFATLGLAGFLASLVMLFLYIYMPNWEKNKTALSSLIGTGFLSGSFVMVALFVFGFKVAEEIEGTSGISEWFLSWSYSLACTAFVLNQIAAAILITEKNRLVQNSKEAIEDKHFQNIKLSEELKSFLHQDNKIPIYERSSNDGNTKISKIRS